MPIAIATFGPDTSQDELVAIARMLRRRAAQDMPPYSTMQIIEACFPGTHVTGRRLGAGIDEMVHVDSLVWQSNRAPHVIVYNRERSTAEQRFAIVHALAHIIFDGPRVVGCRESVERELRCDRLADEVLVPLDELAQYVCASPSEDPDKHEAFLDMVDQIASQFGVTSSVIRRRISELVR